MTTIPSYVSSALRAEIQSILSDPAAHRLTKDIVVLGLSKDPVDAYYDVLRANEVLKKVMDEALGRLRQRVDSTLTGGL